MSPPANTRLFSALRRVIDDARTISKGAPVVLTSHHVEARALPEPIPITPQLLELGLPQAAADTLSKAYIRSGLQLKRKTEAFIYSSLNAGGVKESSQIYNVYLKMYQQTLEEWTAKVVNSAVARSKTSITHTVHVSEKAEHHTATVTPGSLVKLRYMSKMPALKCGPDRTESRHTCIAPHNKLTVVTNPAQISTSLVLPPAPSYAFPSAYPPTCEWKPLTLHQQSVIPRPEWRLPSLSLRLSDIEVDMDSLTEALMRLRIHTVYDDTTKQPLLDSTRPISSKSTDLADSKSSPAPMILSCKSSRTARTPRQQRNNVDSPPLKSPAHLRPSQRDISVKHRKTQISSHLNSRCMSPPSPTSVDPVTPVTFTFSSKISGFSPRPALPRLDTTSPAAVSNKFTESQSNLACNLKSVIPYPPYRIGGLKKAAPLPRRRPRSLKDTSRSPSGVSTSTLSRTPSLASISSDDSDSPSSHSSPVTPPAPNCELPMMFLEVSLPPNGSYLPHTQCAIAGLDKSQGIHEDILTERAEHNLLKCNVDR